MLISRSPEPHACARPCGSPRTRRTERQRGCTGPGGSLLAESRVLVTRDFSLTSETISRLLCPARTYEKTSMRTHRGPAKSRQIVGPASLLVGASALFGGSVARGITPIERAIAGEPVDRRRRYEQRLGTKGKKRIALIVRSEHVPFFHKLAAFSRLSVDDDGVWQSVMAEPLEFMADVPDDLVGKR